MCTIIITNDIFTTDNEMDGELMFVFQVNEKVKSFILSGQKSA